MAFDPRGLKLAYWICLFVEQDLEDAWSPFDYFDCADNRCMIVHNPAGFIEYPRPNPPHVPIPITKRMKLRPNSYFLGNRAIPHLTKLVKLVEFSEVELVILCWVLKKHLRFIEINTIDFIVRECLRIHRWPLAPVKAFLWAFQKPQTCSLIVKRSIWAAGQQWRAAALFHERWTSWSTCYQTNTADCNWAIWTTQYSLKKNNAPALAGSWSWFVEAD